MVAWVQSAVEGDLEGVQRRLPAHGPPAPASLPVGARQTAALLSARFIYVSPSGAVPGCDATTPVHIVDGGYSDNNGAQSLVDLYTKALEPAVRAYNTAHPDTCVVPIYVHVANGYQGTTPTTLGPRPWRSWRRSPRPGRSTTSWRRLRFNGLAPPSRPLSAVPPTGAFGSL